MDLHRRGELRSIAYHHALAEKLARDPALVERALARLAVWEHAGRVHVALAAAWRELLALPPIELAVRLQEDTPKMAQLRSSSPFAGELLPAQRWQLWRSLRGAP